MALRGVQCNATMMMMMMMVMMRRMTIMTVHGEPLVRDEINN
jgi:hypothetical protein